MIQVRRVFTTAIFAEVTASAAIVVATLPVVVTSPVRLPTAPVTPKTLLTGEPPMYPVTSVDVIEGVPVVALQVAFKSIACVAVVSSVQAEAIRIGAALSISPLLLSRNTQFPIWWPVAPTSRVTISHFRSQEPVDVQAVGVNAPVLTREEPPMKTSIVSVTAVPFDPQYPDAAKVNGEAAMKAFAGIVRLPPDASVPIRDVALAAVAATSVMELKKLPPAAEPLPLPQADPFAT